MSSRPDLNRVPGKKAKVFTSPSHKSQNSHSATTKVILEAMKSAGTHKSCDKLPPHVVEPATDSPTSPKTSIPEKQIQLTEVNEELFDFHPSSEEEMKDDGHKEPSTTFETHVRTQKELEGRLFIVGETACTQFAPFCAAMEKAVFTASGLGSPDPSNVFTRIDCESLSSSTQFYMIIVPEASLKYLRRLAQHDFGSDLYPMRGAFLDPDFVPYWA